MVADAGRKLARSLASPGGNPLARKIKPTHDARTIPRPSRSNGIQRIARLYECGVNGDLLPVAGSGRNRLLLGGSGTVDVWQMSTAAVRTAAPLDHRPTLDETTAVSAEDLHLPIVLDSVVSRDCPPTPGSMAYWRRGLLSASGTAELFDAEIG
ncbi:MAG: hypothetical protein Q8K58_01270 [Acidimicrobiales bacterium]|nr:hypothetical protein [Acidimicrobiales bacterium]